MTHGETPSEDRSKGGRVWFAHFVRGPAALLVMFEHLGTTYPTHQAIAGAFGYYKPTFQSISAPWLPVYAFASRLGISPGAVAVSLFLLVSGFVIPYSLERVAVSAFTLRRILRLYPTLAVCVLIAMTALWFNHHLGGLQPPNGTRIIAANISLLAPYFHLRWIEPTAWTLATEEIFYVTAALLATFGLLKHSTAVLGVGVGAAVIALLPTVVDSAPFWFQFYVTYIPFVFVGVAMHHAYSGRWSIPRASVVGVTLFVLFAIALHSGPHNYEAVAYSRSAGLALVIFVGLAMLGPRLPYSRVIDGLSSITYPLYLLHGTNGYVVMHQLQMHGVSYFVALPIAIGMAILGAIIVHHFVEEPTLRLGRRLGGQLVERRDARRNVDIHSGA